MASNIGALYFISGRGDVLIQRLYRDDIEYVVYLSFRRGSSHSHLTAANVFF